MHQTTSRTIFRWKKGGVDPRTPGGGGVRDTLFGGGRQKMFQAFCNDDGGNPLLQGTEPPPGMARPPPGHQNHPPHPLRCSDQPRASRGLQPAILSVYAPGKRPAEAPTKQFFANNQRGREGGREGLSLFQKQVSHSFLKNWSVIPPPCRRRASAHSGMQGNNYH